MLRGRSRALLSLLLWLAAAPALAANGDPDSGEAIYAKRCLMCHGEDGDGLGPAAERLNPPPRDFTLGLYKIKTSAFDEDYPNDADIFRMIRDGMPGTAMPGWRDMLSEQQMWDLVAYLKALAEIEEAPEGQIDFSGQVASSAESIEQGRRLFLEGDRCAECHGQDGKGDAIKKLKDDNGARTWPRNLTKPWTFRGSNDPRDIYARISTGIPGTQMPPFADPKSKKRLNNEERWHIANFVASLAKVEERVRPENTVIRAAKLDGEAPSAVDDPRWAEAVPTSFFMLPQLITGDRFFMPANDTVTVRALYDDQQIALLLEWDDRTQSIPGDPQAESIAEGELGEDAVAVQLPVTIPDGMEKPYFIRGDASHPVNLWTWSSGTTETPAAVTLQNATGLGTEQQRDAGEVGLTAAASYQRGTWRVLMRRPLQTQDRERDIQFVQGRFIPIAFAAWDGSNGEAGSSHTLTTWYWLLLEPPMGLTPLLAALAVAVVLGAGEWWWAANVARRRRGGAASEGEA